MSWFFFLLLFLVLPLLIYFFCIKKKSGKEQEEERGKEDHVLVRNTSKPCLQRKYSSVVLRGQEWRSEDHQSDGNMRIQLRQASRNKDGIFGGGDGGRVESLVSRCTAHEVRAMGRKKKTKKSLENSLQLRAEFRGVEEEVVTAVLQEAEGDVGLASARLQSMMKNSLNMQPLEAQESNINMQKGDFGEKKAFVKGWGIAHGKGYKDEGNSNFQESLDDDWETACSKKSKRKEERVKKKNLGNIDYDESSNCSLTYEQYKLGVIAEKSKEDRMQEVQDLFPSLEADVIEKLVEASQGDMEAVLSFLSDSSEGNELGAEYFDENHLVPIKQFFYDFLPPKEVDEFFELKGCDERSSLEVLQMAATDLLQFLPLDSCHPSGLLGQSWTDSQSSDNEPAASSSSFPMREYLEAKQCVESFFKRTGKPLPSDEAIVTALELSQSLSISDELNVDAAISYLLDQYEASSCMTRKSSTDKKTHPKSSQPSTYASKVMQSLEDRKVACMFGGGSQMAAHHFGSGSQTLHSSRGLCLDAASTTTENESTNITEMAKYWREVGEESKALMVKAFAVAQSAKSTSIYSVAIQHKQNIYKAQLQCAKFELMGRNRHIAVHATNERLEFGGFVVRSIPTRTTIDLHGLDVRSAKGFVASLVDKCVGMNVSITLIVGKGNHSVNNAPRLKPALRQQLEQCPTVKMTNSSDGTIEFIVL